MDLEETPPDPVMAAWYASDQARAVLPADRELIESTRSVRALICELARAGGSEDELYDACAVLGRLIANQGGSPTLASVTIDHACSALGASDAPWAVPARAAVAEGFAAALVEGARQQAMKAWDFPSCTVPLGEAAVAIAADYPSDDEELLAVWAANVAKAAALGGVRRAIVAGNERASAAVVEALEFAGVEVRTAQRRRTTNS
jgi:hypothetical protein